MRYPCELVFIIFVNIVKLMLIPCRPINLAGALPVLQSERWRRILGSQSGQQHGGSHLS